MAKTLWTLAGLMLVGIILLVVRQYNPRHTCLTKCDENMKIDPDADCKSVCHPQQVARDQVYCALANISGPVKECQGIDATILDKGANLKACVERNSASSEQHKDEVDRIVKNSVVTDDQIASWHQYCERKGLKLAQPQVVSLSSANFPSKYIRHKHLFGELEQIGDSDLDKKDASFKLVPGLADKNCNSFESVNFPAYYLAHEQFRIKLKPIESAQGFRQDATFCKRPGLWGEKMASWESYNASGRYLRHRDFHLWVEAGSDELFKKDATFHLEDPLWKD